MSNSEISNLEITFRLLNESDILTYHTWQAKPDVYKFYGGKAFSLEENETDLSFISGSDKGKTFGYIFSFNGLEAGYIQRYSLKFYHEESAMYKDDSYDFDLAQGVDLFIGEDKFRNKGLGAKVIKEFITKKIFVDLETKHCIVDPDPANIRAVKAYTKAGFKPIKVIPKTKEMDSDVLLMLISQAEFFEKENK